MLIMPESKRRFPALATEVVEAFFRDGIPLTRGVADVAAKAELSPEEVRRLTEQANTAAVVRLLRMTDKKAVFDLAHLEDVLALTHPAQDDVSQAGQPVYRGLPEEKPLAKAASLVSLFGLSPREKTAARSEASQRDLLGEWRRLCKQAEEASRRKMALETALQDGIDRLAVMFRRRSPAEFAKFASEALCLYPDTARHIVEGLASHLGHAFPLEKAAGIVDDRREELRLMAAVCGGMKQWGACANEATRWEKAAEAAWKNVLQEEKSGEKAAC